MIESKGTTKIRVSRRLVYGLVAIAITAGAVTLVLALIPTPVSATITLEEGIRYWISPPLCSDITSSSAS